MMSSITLKNILALLVLSSEISSIYARSLAEKLIENPAVHPSQDDDQPTLVLVDENGMIFSISKIELDGVQQLGYVTQYDSTDDNEYRGGPFKKNPLKKFKKAFKFWAPKKVFHRILTALILPGSLAGIFTGTVVSTTVGIGAGAIAGSIAGLIG